MSSKYSNDDAPSGQTAENSYVSRDKGEPIGVQADDAPVDDPIDDNVANADEQLERDDADAIDESNIISGDKTRHAKPTGTYREPGDDEGLPSDTGRSDARAA